MLDARTRRTVTGLVPERSDLLGLTCGADLDPAVRQIAYVTIDSVALGRLKNEPAEAHALNPSGDTPVREAQIGGRVLFHLVSLRPDDRKRLVGAP